MLYEPAVKAGRGESGIETDLELECQVLRVLPRLRLGRDVGAQREDAVFVERVSQPDLAIRLEPPCERVKRFLAKLRGRIKRTPYAAATPESQLGQPPDAAGFDCAFQAFPRS